MRNNEKKIWRLEGPTLQHSQSYHIIQITYSIDHRLRVMTKSLSPCQKCLLQDKLKFRIQVGFLRIHRLLKSDQSESHSRLMVIKQTLRKNDLQSRIKPQHTLNNKLAVWPGLSHNSQQVVSKAKEQLAVTISLGSKHTKQYQFQGTAVTVVV
jgi:hypothetical protein